jgi:dUTP pyrophosphatase
MKFAKIRDVKSPCRGTSKSAGIDFFVPNYSKDFLKVFQEKNPACPNDSEGFYVRPHSRVLIPSGVKCAVPEGYGLIAFNKSGVFTNHGLCVGACVVDPDYMGEIHISLFNSTENKVKILWGQKIIQFLLIPIFFDNIKEVNIDNLFINFESERKDGGFGSTGV